MGLGRDVRRAQQNHDWSDGRRRASSLGRMTRQHRGVIIKGDSRAGGPILDRAAKAARRLKK